MNRSGFYYKRKALVDIKYGSTYMCKFINKVMLHGNKTVVTKIVYDALARLEENTSRDGLEILLECLKKIVPTVYLRSKRIASKVYRIPVVISEAMAMKIALKWLVKSIRERKEYKLEQRIYSELNEILAGKGDSLKMKENYHRIAKDNEAFVHYG